MLLSPPEISISNTGKDKWRGGGIEASLLSMLTQMTIFHFPRRQPKPHEA